MRNIIDLHYKLSNLHCYDEADGSGSAEPYIWTLFFKVDGDTVTVNERLTLDGFATIVSSNGAHGNLNTRDVDSGNDIPIPSELGEWKTFLKPIQLSPEAKQMLQVFNSNIEDFQAIAGMICVLMEEDALSDSSVVAGYNAFVATVTHELNELISNFHPGNTQIKSEDINEMIKKIGEAVEGAVRGDLNIAESIWAFISGPDQQIGTHFMYHDTDQLTHMANTPIRHRWTGDAGDWEISGELLINQIVQAPFGNNFVPSGKEPNLNGVMMFEESYFNTRSIQPANPFLRARKQLFKEGSFNLPFDIDNNDSPNRFRRTLGVRPNSISSIKVGEGYYCELFDGPNSTGQSIEINANYENLPQGWDNKAMSVVVGRSGIPH